jgi:probable rRNA maturation factor
LIPKQKIGMHNRQRGVRLDLPWLRRFAGLALPAAVPHSANGAFALRLIEEIEVAIVSDRTIARVHRQFMALPDPTDVITFAHGEIVMSAETAQMRAPEFGHSTEEELALYTVHGLLHLNGFEDATSQDAARMRKIQNRIWKECLVQIPSPKPS